MITRVHLDLNLLLKAVETVKLIQRELLRRYRFFSSSVFSPDDSACTEGGEWGKYPTLLCSPE